MKGDAPRTQAGEVEDVRDEIELEARVALDGAQHLLLIGAERPALALGQHLDVADDDVQRRAELVRDGREELRLQVVRALELEHLLLEGAAVLLERGAAAGEALRHRIEGACEPAQLVPRPDIHLGSEVTARDRVSCRRQGLEGTGDGAREEQGGPDREEREKRREDARRRHRAMSELAERGGRETDRDRAERRALRLELRIAGEDRHAELPHVGPDRDRPGRTDLRRRRDGPRRRAADRDEHEALAIEHPAVDDSALRASLLGELPQAVDVAGEDADRRLLREVLPDRPTPLGQIPADVLEVALREDPALRDADDHDQHRGREAEAAGEAERTRLETPAGAQPWQGSAPEHQPEKHEQSPCRLHRRDPARERREREPKPRLAAER